MAMRRAACLFLSRFMGHYCIEGGGSCDATLASGLGFIVGPEEPIQSLLLTTQASADCSNLERLPSVFFRVLGHDFEVSPTECVPPRPAAAPPRRHAATPRHAP